MNADTQARKIGGVKSEYNCYDIYAFGPLSTFNGGPWAVHVRFKDSGMLFDAIYGLKNASSAAMAAVKSIREG